MDVTALKEKLGPDSRNLENPWKISHLRTICDNIWQALNRHNRKKL